MKKWFIVIGLVVLLASGSSAYFFYKAIRSPLAEEENKAVQTLLENSNIETIDDISHYYGSSDYQVITGKDQEGKEWIAIVSVEGDDIVEISADEGVTKAEVKEFVETNLSPKEIVSIRLGLEYSMPVYEITYIDENNRYIFYYVSFQDGAFVKRYSLKQG